MDKYSFLNAINQEYIDFLYKKYLEDPNKIESSWCAFFQGFDFSKETYKVKDFNNKKIFDKNEVIKNFKILNLIYSYRSRGHLFTKTNPIINNVKYYPDLSLSNFGLSESDLDINFDPSKIIGIPKSSLREIIYHLNRIYCNSIGIEYIHINDLEKINWIQKWININDNQPNISIKKKKKILVSLYKALSFEKFLNKKFTGQKRFSIEGIEAVLPSLNELVEYSVKKYNVNEFIIGMAHRGRLNILSNFLNKKFSYIFKEFEGIDDDKDIFYGDVKYHLGYISCRNIGGKNIKISLVPNPSHLEAVCSILEGITRAKIDNYYKGNNSNIIPILIHGDASISGQGIVYEVIQMSNLKGYKTGGTIHIIINNQIGFTTDYIDARSSIYCTDIAKILGSSPVLHVNADDVEAVIHCINFAVDFRMRYKQDVFIDIIGYRKYGHNEGDEPRFTQPSLYKIIDKHINCVDNYKDKLYKKGIIDSNFISDMENSYEKLLNDSYEESKYITLKENNNFFISENKFSLVKDESIFKKINTNFSKEKLIEIHNKINILPKNKIFYRKIEKLLKNRYEIVHKKKLVDWGIAELLAYGSLLYEGYNIRLSGEDVERGTFSHRHIIIKAEDDESFILLNHINKKQGKIYIYNSLLSEYGVLGFDYGYAMYATNTLTLWEAQFGDFANGSQIIIDQYISSAEDKWNIQNGLVLLLPHGYEGQGPEHSSARIERYLQLCANYNMFLANCTTPANFYHILRRQMKFNFRKPLIIFTPKSLLRHKKCISHISELSEGRFQEIIDDLSISSKETKKLIFCSGKIYYEILEKRETLNDNKTAIIRIEQIYPLNKKLLIKIINNYHNYKYLLWVQEEPENMGVWSYISKIFINNLSLKLILISPKENANTAPGSGKHFFNIQKKIIDMAFEYS